MILFILVLCITGLITWALEKPFESFLLKIGMGRKNYRGETIPCGMGILFLLISGSVFLIAPFLDINGWDYKSWLFYVTVLVFGILGFLDDKFGTRGVGGFKGHFMTLLIQHKLTTGAVKAIVGGLFSLYIGWNLVGIAGEPSGIRLSHVNIILQTLINGGLIALSANVINLLDTRPARALKVWGVLILIFILGSPLMGDKIFGNTFGLVFGAMAAVVFVYGIRDLNAESMLGDVGSNPLGAVLGVACCMEMNLTARIILFLLAVFFNLFCEKFSVSQLLDRRKNSGNS